MFADAESDVVRTRIGVCIDRLEKSKIAAEKHAGRSAMWDAGE